MLKYETQFIFVTKSLLLFSVADVWNEDERASAEFTCWNTCYILHLEDLAGSSSLCDGVQPTFWVFLSLSVERRGETSDSSNISVHLKLLLWTSLLRGSGFECRSLLIGWTEDIHYWWFKSNCSKNLNTESHSDEVWTTSVSNKRKQQQKNNNPELTF